MLPLHNWHTRYKTAIALSAVRLIFFVAPFAGLVATTPLYSSVLCIGDGNREWESVFRDKGGGSGGKRHQDDGLSIHDPAFWGYLGIAAVLTLCGGGFAGLTIALMGQVRRCLCAIGESVIDSNPCSLLTTIQYPCVFSG